MSYLLAFVFTYRGALVPLALVPVAVLPWEPYSHIRYFTGLALLSLGIFFRVAGVRRIGGRARVHSAGARHLATTGIFGHVRNPLYLGNILYAGGLLALLFSLWSAGLAAFFLLGLYTLIALYEEAALEFQLSTPYRRYMEEVPRWRFRLRPYKASCGTDPVAPLREVIRCESLFILFGIVLCFFASSIQLGFIDPSRLTEILDYEYRALAGTILILLICTALFLRVAIRIGRKRGSWLKVCRITKNGSELQRYPCEPSASSFSLRRAGEPKSTETKS